MRFGLPLLVRTVLAAAALTAVGLAAPPAAAKCMMPGAVLAPASGSVPVNPVLHLMVPTRTANPPLPRVVAHRGDKQVPVTVTADTASGDLRTYRVVITAAAGPLKVELLDAQGTVMRSWTFTVDPHWQPPKVTTAAVTVTHDVSSWTCSHTRTRNLRFTGTAAAYRVVLADAAAKTSIVVPADPGDYFHTPLAPPTDVDLALGHVNCFGDTLEWTVDKIATVHALLPDGNEQPVSRAPVVLAPP